MKDLILLCILFFVLTPSTIIKSTSSIGTTIAIDKYNQLLIEEKKSCVELHTEISASGLQSCMPVNFIVQVCNQGGITSKQSYVDVRLANQFDKIFNSSITYSNVDPNLYRFQLGELKSDQCTTLYFSAKVLCNNVIPGQTLCYSAQAYPDTTCWEENPNWSGADIKVEGKCFGNTLEFMIKNTGAEKMKTQGDYTIIKNDKLYQNSTFQLLSGESKIINLPADGATWRLEATQELNHPNPFILSRTIEACSTNNDFTIGYAMMYPVSEKGFAYDEECQEVIDVFVPNEIVAFPYGYDHPNLIKPNTELEYSIRFQNMGKDTVHTILIEDVLPDAFDAKSVHSILSNHRYTMKMDSVDHLIFRFENIRLPGDLVDKNASRGFVSFIVNQKPNNYTRVLIKNTASIYFDSKPVINTKAVFREVGRVIGVVATSEEEKSERTVVDLDKDKFETIFQIETKAYDQSIWTIHDFLGQSICSGTIAGKTVKLPSNYNFQGFFLFEIHTKNKGKVYKKLILN